MRKSYERKSFFESFKNMIHLNFLSTVLIQIIVDPFAPVKKFKTAIKKLLIIKKKLLLKALKFGRND